MVFYLLFMYVACAVPSWAVLRRRCIYFINFIGRIVFFFIYWSQNNLEVSMYIDQGPVNVSVRHSKLSPLSSLSKRSPKQFEF